MNITYRITCKSCPNPPAAAESRGQYVGCSGRTLHKRSKEHEDDIRDGKLKNAMAKHYHNSHPEAVTHEDLIEVELIAHHKDTLTRFVDESLRLEAEGDTLANSKGEWGRGGGLVRLIPMSTQSRQSETTHSQRTMEGGTQRASWNPG